jgi:hypothetical protein
MNKAGITIPDDKVPEEGTLSIPNNTSETDLKAMLANANASLGSKLTLTRSYNVEETTDEVAYSYDEVIQIDSTGKKFLYERKNVKADGKTKSLAGAESLMERLIICTVLVQISLRAALIWTAK